MPWMKKRAVVCDNGYFVAIEDRNLVQGLPGSLGVIAGENTFVTSVKI